MSREVGTTGLWDNLLAGYRGFGPSGLDMCPGTRSQYDYLTVISILATHAGPELCPALYWKSFSRGCAHNLCQGLKHKSAVIGRPDIMRSAPLRDRKVRNAL